MSEQDQDLDEDPRRDVYARTLPEVDPPSLALALDLERRMAEGDVILFADDGPNPSRLFELHRVAGVFRINDGLMPLRGAWASAAAAIREGWATLDARAAAIAEGPGVDLPPISSLLGPADPDGGEP